MTVSDWVRPSPKSAPVQSKAAGLYMICSLSKHAAESMDLMMLLCLIIEAILLKQQGQYFCKKNILPLKLTVSLMDDKQL